MVTASNIKIPNRKVGKASEKKPQRAFRPKTLSYLKNITKKTGFALNSFMKDPAVKKILIRSDLKEKGLEDKISKVQKIEKDKIEGLAYEYAKKDKARYVEVEHLFVAVAAAIPNVDTILSAFGTDLRTLEETASWIVKKRENLETAYFWQDDYSMPPIGGFGHGLTGRVTPNLDAISRDFTKLAKKHQLETIVGRDEEIEKISKSLGGSNENILLIGEPGSGKTSIVIGMAHRIIHGTKFKSLRNKRIISLEMGSLIAGARHAGTIAEKLKNAMDEIVASKDIVLFLDEIHSLVASVDGNDEFSTIFSILEPYLDSNHIQFVGATNVENYRKYIEPMGSFSRLFEIIEIPQSNFDDTLEILKFEASREEKKYKITVSTPALIRIIELSEKLIHDRVLPDKALDILNRSINKVRDSTKFLRADDVDKVISEMTHIPVTAVTEDESEKLLGIEEEMKKRVIGQDHAISKIAAAIKRARVGIRDEKKPIASFLFVGTTGVGKTETAKTLSGTYFGDRKAMIRLDMSEYQSPDSIDKLIGTSDGKTKGLLTEQVRNKPFAVVLLDEVEKAHHQVILAFLQVLDDGRLTDSSGRTVDFTNTIIIATSNAGTKQIQEATTDNKPFEEIENVAILAVREKFAPEFLNRFTGIVVYKPLDKDNVRKIAKILLESVKTRMRAKKVEVEFSEDLIDGLIERGYNPEWGARPMARTIEENIETYLANKLLKKEIKQGDRITLGKEVFS